MSDAWIYVISCTVLVSWLDEQATGQSDGKLSCMARYFTFGHNVQTLNQIFSYLPHL